MPEKTRTKVHQEDAFDRDEIHKDDTSQIKILSKKIEQQGSALKNHCQQNEISDSEIKDQLKSIRADQAKTSWLAEPEIVKLMKDILEGKRAETYISKRVTRIIGITLSVAGIFAAIFTSIWYALKLTKHID
jgi:hypothetical protein